MQEVEPMTATEKWPTIREYSRQFNIYMNDQLIHLGLRNFIYANDLRIIAEAKDLAQPEAMLTSALSGLSVYYTKNQLYANPSVSRPSLES